MKYFNNNTNVSNNSKVNNSTNVNNNTNDDNYDDKIIDKISDIRIIVSRLRNIVNSNDRKKIKKKLYEKENKKDF